MLKRLIVEPVEFAVCITDEVNLRGGCEAKDTATDCVECALMGVDQASSALLGSVTMS